MGKIGDLIVRLQLKHEDYKKGLKSAEQETKGFGVTLGKIKNVGLAVWGAIGGAVIKFSKDLIASTNRMGDAWAVFTSKAKARWDTFLSAVSSWDFQNFFARMRQAAAETAEFTKALDTEFEVSNSIRLQRAAIEEELAALKVVMQDATKPFDERIKAAQDYLDKVSPIYDQILAQAKKMEDAHLGKWLAGTGITDSDQVRNELRKFLVDIGKNSELADNLAQMLALYPRYKQANSVQLRAGKVGMANPTIDQYEALYKKVNEWALANGYSAVYGSTGTRLFDFFRVYNDMRGDTATAPLIEALIAAGQAAGAKNRETAEIQSVLNGLIQQRANAAVVNAVQDVAAKSDPAFISTVGLQLDGILPEVEWPKLPDIIPDGWLERNQEKIDAALAEAQRLQGITDEINRQVNDAVVASLSNATQALADCIMGIEGANAEQVLAALLQPFAQTMISLGEILLAEGLAIEVFKESLASLQGAPAIAAGLGLIALGSALAAGIQALSGSSSASAASSGYDSAGSGSGGIETYEQEITVHVIGEISGDKIVLMGDKTLKKWGR